MADVPIVTDFTDEKLANIKLFEDNPEELLLFGVVCCGIYMLIGIPGNLITIAALVRCKKIQNATTVFIINLAWCDMLFCCFNLPLISATYWQKYWSYGVTVCRMFPMAGYGLAAVSLFNILAIMVNRYILIAYPRLYTKIYKARYIAVMVAITWILPFGFFIPTWLEKWGRFGLNPDIGACTILPDSNHRSPKKFVIGLVIIPCILVLVCYLRIFCIVRESAKRAIGTTKQKTQQKQEVPIIVSSLTESVPSQVSSDSGIDTNHLAPPQSILSSSLHAAADLSSSQSISSERCDVSSSDSTSTPIRTHDKDVIKRFRHSAAILKRARVPKAFRLSKKDRNLLQIIMTLIVSFWVCYLPVTIIKIFCDSSPVARVLGNLLVYLPSCINPIIYVVMSREYRQAYKRLFSCDDTPESSRATDTKNSKSQKKSEARIQMQGSDV